MLNLGIIGQCDSFASSLCLHIVIRYGKAYFGFYNNDVTGLKTLLLNRWYHLAFAFDSSSNNRSIYINGMLDQSDQSSQPYQGHSGNMTIGWVSTNSVQNSNEYLYGYIDQFSVTHQSKSSDEILNDATLCCYFSFDDGSLADQDPLEIRGVLNGSTAAFPTGRVGDALQLSNSHASFFQMQKLVHLGMTNRSYSMSIWLFPDSQQSSTIIRVSSTPDSATDWCVSMLALHTGGQLAAFSYAGGVISLFGPTIVPQQWTHVAFTYSSANGMKLYVNGTLINSTAPFTYTSNRAYMYVTLGTIATINQACVGTPSGNASYDGLLDEFRLYSRELSSNEIICLANP